MRGRTCFLISHRPAALEDCDTRLVISNRRLVATDHASAAAPPEADLVLRGSNASA